MASETVATLTDVETGEVFRLGRITRIGRAKDNHVVLSTGSVSKWHSRIEIEEDENECDNAVLFDVGSRNGTFVGSSRVGPRQDGALPHGAIVRFGNDQRKFRFELARPGGGFDDADTRVEANLSQPQRNADIPVTVAFLDAQGVRQQTSSKGFTTMSQATASGSTLPGIPDDATAGSQQPVEEDPEPEFQVRGVVAKDEDQSGDSSPFPNLMYSPSPERDAAEEDEVDHEASERLQTSWMRPEVEGADGDAGNPFRGSMQWADPRNDQGLQAPPLPDVNALPATTAMVAAPIGRQRDRLLEERRKAGEHIRSINEALSGMRRVDTVSFQFDGRMSEGAVDLRARELRRCFLRRRRVLRALYFRHWARHSASTSNTVALASPAAEDRSPQGKRLSTMRNLALRSCEQRLRHRLLSCAVIRWWKVAASQEKAQRHETEAELLKAHETLESALREKAQLRREKEELQKRLDTALTAPQPLARESSREMPRELPRALQSGANGEADSPWQTGEIEEAPQMEENGATLLPSLGQVVLRQKHEIEELRKQLVRTEEMQAMSRSMRFERLANEAETSNLIRIVKTKEQKIDQLYEYLGQIAGLWIAKAQPVGRFPSGEMLPEQKLGKDQEARRQARRLASNLLVTELRCQRKEALDQLGALRVDLRQAKERFAEELARAAVQGDAGREGAV